LNAVLSPVPAVATSFAGQYVGRPWTPTFNCWALVQLVQRQHFGREMPPLDIGLQPDRQQQRVLAALLGRGRPWAVTTTPACGDVLVCRSADGPHVGVMLDGRRVLHNRGSLRQAGGVRVDRVVDLATAGYSRLTYWTAQT
jgi:cell wall-associated NlpC family hydrolase